MPSWQCQTRGQRGLVLSQGGTTPETGERHTHRAVSRQNNKEKTPCKTGPCHRTRYGKASNKGQKKGECIAKLVRLEIHGWIPTWAVRPGWPRTKGRPVVVCKATWVGRNGKVCKAKPLAMGKRKGRSQWVVKPP